MRCARNLSSPSLGTSKVCSLAWPASLPRKKTHGARSRKVSDDRKHPRRCPAHHSQCQPKGTPAAEESPTPAETYAFDLDVEEAEPSTVADEPPLASTVPPMIQHVETPEIYSLEIETALMELRERLPEIRAFARDFLMVSSTTNVDDMDAFILSLRAQGFATDHPPVHQAVANVIMELDFQIKNESNAATAMPQSWGEREALRRFEEVRSTLRDRLENILALHKGDVVKARMAFEEEGEPSISTCAYRVYPAAFMPCLTSTSN